MSTRKSGSTGPSRKRRVYRTPWTEALAHFSEEELDRIAGGRSLKSEWRDLGVPADVMLPRVLAKLTPDPGGSEHEKKDADKPVHLRRGFQRTHTFTMIVQAMWDLEVRYEGGDKEAWPPLRKIWDLLHAIRPFVADEAGWKDEDWERLVGVDHWRRITKIQERKVEQLLAQEEAI